MRYRAHKMGIGSGDTAFATSPYEPKAGARHRAAADARVALESRRRRGSSCSAAPASSCSAELRGAGHDVASSPTRAAATAADRRRRRRPRRRHPGAVGADFDVVVASTRSAGCATPTRCCEQSARARAGRRADGVACRTSGTGTRDRRCCRAAGYDRRGILDERTLRFFTRREAERLFQADGIPGHPPRDGRAPARGRPEHRAGGRRRHRSRAAAVAVRVPARLRAGAVRLITLGGGPPAASTSAAPVPSETSWPAKRGAAPFVRARRPGRALRPCRARCRARRPIGRPPSPGHDAAVWSTCTSTANRARGR